LDRSTIGKSITKGLEKACGEKTIVKNTFDDLREILPTITDAVWAKLEDPYRETFRILMEGRSGFNNLR
jgi:hypothetical protein